MRGGVSAAVADPGRLPAFVRPIALRAGNLQSLARGIAAAADPNGYTGDGIATYNIAGFLDDPRFEFAYGQAVSAAGWDFGIEWRLHQALWAARTALHVPGDFVELGTGRGFIMVGVLHGLEKWPQGDRNLWLFDTFEAGRIDAAGEHGSAVSPYYAVSYETTKATFSKWDGVNIVKGRLPASLAGSPIQEIAFLHIDLNHHVAEVESLTMLWQRISPGGIVLLDDYANKNHEAQHRAMNDLADELGVAILTTATGQGIMVKPPKAQA